ncbi:TfoX family protein [Thalassobius vesicularis]|uniref:TfoX family protein n=1 Tax=Thalassobius vesicularis TaxID=1294297 RepID=A0A4S3MAJ0_9RHOB|nr:TfoX/Sxy family protein [Thalassobius vesicularis]THD74774.1 TfoX family protein [Thalassobius vesicularis]
MAVDAEFLEHLLELFSGLGPLRKARMFSGFGIYADGDAMFAMLTGEGRVFMKTDAQSGVEYLAAGSEPFSYARGGKITQVHSFMSLPESALDDPDEALRWARLSLPAAQAAAVQKRRKAR